MTGPGPQRRRPRAVLAVLLLASFAVITLDVRGGTSSPLEPLRAAAGDVFGPAETAVSTAVRPVRELPGYLTTTGRLRGDVARLQAENARLRTAAENTALDAHRVTELDGLATSARRLGYTLLPARVVGIGPAQSFSRTVTIDAGTRQGVHRDMTVLDNDGLVGRVVRADRSSATVLLIVDAESVVGGRLGRSMEIGYLRGRGELSGSSPLDLELVDGRAVPQRGDVVSTWGSRHGTPYVAGIPIGRVTAVRSSPRQLSSSAVIAPFVDFSSLDLVGVVVRARTTTAEAAGTPTGGTP